VRWVSAPQPPTPVRLMLPPPSDVNKTPFIELTSGQCKFIAGDREPYFACGAPVTMDAPYCEYHCRICYNRSTAVDLRGIP
jgi:hypothetical protein